MVQTDVKQTKSERIFEEYCTKHRIQYVRIPCTDTKTPDYDIVLGDRTVVTEVKQIETTKHDARCFAEHRGWSNTDDRIRYKIQQCRKQFKQRSKGKLPTLLVIYDNGSFGGIDGDDIKVAMYGDETVVITETETATIVSPIHPGGRRKCTSNDNTSISAIGLMWNSENETQLSIFHNHFAAIPINPNWFRSSAFHHYQCNPTNRERAYEWCKA